MSNGNNSGRGSNASKHPLQPEVMARVCRQMASDMRREHLRGEGPIPLSAQSGHVWMPRDQAAEATARQADRWQHECDTGELNIEDRKKIGA